MSSAATEMRALRIERFGEPADMRVRQIARPQIGRGIALVRVRAAAINPSDALNARGAMSQTRLPRTPGRDYAGTVEQAPDKWVGRDVWGSGGDLGFTRDGTHAEYVAVPVSSLRAMPNGLTYARAAAVGTAYITPWVALVDRARLKPGESLLIVGGAGAVGRAAAQIARRIGARVLATVRDASEGDADWRGDVDVVIDLASDDVLEAVHRATNGRGVDVALNAVGGSTFLGSAAALAAKGRLVSISAAAGRDVSFDLMDFYRFNKRLDGLNTLGMSTADCARVLESMRGGFETGAFNVREPDARGLDGAIQAYADVARGSRAKIVITIDI